jgi:hypothetical protein
VETRPSPDYEARLRAILEQQDWQALREFSREQNQIPDDVYNQDDHFWQVLMHKIICNRLDTIALHETSRKWLSDNGYTADLGGY